MHEISNKISKTGGIISKLNKVLPQITLKMIYNSLILPHLQYGISSWGFCNTSRLLTIQKRVVRSILNTSLFAHSEPLFKRLELLRVDDIFKLSFFKLYYKLSNKTIPMYFQNFQFHTHPPSRTITHPLRLNDFNFNLPITQPVIPIINSNKRSSEKRFRHFLPYLVNTHFLSPVAMDRLNTHSFQSFMNYVKKEILSKYSDHCSIENCIVCDFLRNP